MSRCILFAALATVWTLPSLAEPTGRQVADEADVRNRADSEVATFEMTIVNKKGKERKRELKSWALTPPGEPERAMIRFLDPPDVAGTSVLTIELSGDEDEQWMYLPALKRTRRIAGSSRNDSFMGSDLSYDDLRPRDLDSYEYEILKSETVGGDETWALQSTPKAGGKAEDSAYSRTVAWIRKADYVPLKSEHFDEKGELLKVITYEGYTEDSGVMRPASLKVENVQKGTHTVIRYVERTLNGELDESLFTTRAMESEIP